MAKPENLEELKQLHGIDKMLAHIELRKANTEAINHNRKERCRLARQVWLAKQIVKKLEKGE